MKIVFLPSSRKGLRWFHDYYVKVFAEGKKNADRQFLSMQRVLLTTPEAGRPTGIANVRIFSMPRTPFSVIYRVREDRIEILHLHDQRSESEPEGG